MAIKKGRTQPARQRDIHQRRSSWSARASSFMGQIFDAGGTSQVGPSNLKTANNRKKQSNSRNNQGPKNDQASEEIRLNVWGGRKFYPPQDQDLAKAIAWQVERHINWAPENPPWRTRHEFYAILDMRSSHELRAGDPFGRGNFSLNLDYCKVPPSVAGANWGWQWGKPAEVLKKYADFKKYKGVCWWLAEDEPRSLLLDMEDWYFSLPTKERDALGWRAAEWCNRMPDELSDRFWKLFKVSN